MAKRRIIKGNGRLLVRAGFNVVVAGIFFGIFMAFLGGLTAGGIILSEVIALFVLVMVVPQIFRIRKGQETLMALVLGIPIGLSVVSIVGTLFPNLIIPTIGVSGLAIGTFPFVIAITSYFLADWMFVQFFK